MNIKNEKEIQTWEKLKKEKRKYIIGCDTPPE